MFVEINRDGFILNRWSPKRKTYIRESSLDPISLLRHRCEVSPDATFGDVLRLVRQHEKLQDFMVAYSHCQVFNDYCKQLEEKQVPDVTVQRLEFSWVVDAENDFYLFPSIYGVRKDQTKFPFVSSSLPGIRHAGIHLNKLCQMNMNDEDNTFTKSFSLLEILSPIFWEIGFYGRDYINEFLRRHQAE